MMHSHATYIPHDPEAKPSSPMVRDHRAMAYRAADALAEAIKTGDLKAIDRAALHYSARYVDYLEVQAEEG
jgi:hypothetical protein